MTRDAQSQGALWEREAQFRLFFVHSLEAIFLTAPDGAILDANPEACRLFGRTVEELQALGRQGTVDVTDPRLPAALAERARTGRFRGALRMVRKDGSRLECEVSSVVFKDDNGETRTHTVVRDVTDRKRAEAALREERNFIKAFIETTSALILVTDPEGRIVRFNKACELASGRSFDDVQGRIKWEVLVPDEEREGVQRVFKTLCAASSPSHCEYHLQQPNGGRRYIAWSNTCLRDAAGAVKYVVSSGLDLTDQRRAEDELLRRQAGSIRAHRMRAMGALAALLAHGLNQPLAAIAGYAEASRGQVDHVEGVKKLRGNLDQIIQQAERASGTIRELRQFFRRDESSVVPTDLGAVVRTVCALIERLAAARGVRLDCDVDIQLPLVAAQAIEIEHVLMNLLQNALDSAAPTGETGQGRVAVRAWHQEDEKVVRIGVEDGGPGLDASLVERVFEPLFTTKTNGLGLGLTLCRSIIKAHGGTMWAEPGPGGKFYFTLPVAS
jgi:PAS domain S-box-containing protein